jgi:hypothetical protein
MALTKKELSEFVRDILSGGDPAREGKFHDTIIWKAADIVLGGLIQEEMWKSRENNGYDINGSFLSTFVAEVQDDSDRNEKYSVLPHSVISLKDNRGLHRVSEKGNTENAFTQVANGSHDVFRILDAHYLNEKTEYYQEGNNIYYRHIGLAVKEVLIKMVTAITGLEPDQPIAIPSSMEDQFMERVIERLRLQQLTPQDKYNDGNPNMPQR